MHIILMGPQGSGKGTQAAVLGPRLGLVKIATGDLFRAAIAAETDLGRRVESILSRGDLVPDDLTVALVRQRLREIAARRGMGQAAAGALFDGFPRNHDQAVALDALLAEHGESVTAVIEMAVPLERLVERLAGRRVCTDCGAIYHIETNPPRLDGVCDRCGGEVIQRDDDRPEPIRRRLALYAEQTAPILDYYRQRGLLETIDGDQPVAAVTAAITGAIEGRRAGAEM